MNRLEEILAKYPQDESGRHRIAKSELRRLMQRGLFMETTSTGVTYTDWKKVDAKFVIERPQLPPAVQQNVDLQSTRDKVKALIRDGEKLSRSVDIMLATYSNAEKSQPPTSREGNCQLCDTFGPIYRHHLKPKQITRKQREANSKTVHVCFPCHKSIHTIPNKRLYAEFSNIHALRLLIDELRKQNTLNAQ